MQTWRMVGRLQAWAVARYSDPGQPDENVSTKKNAEQIAEREEMNAVDKWITKHACCGQSHLTVHNYVLAGTDARAEAIWPGDKSDVSH